MYVNGVESGERAWVLMLDGALVGAVCQKVGRAGRKTTVNKRWLWRVMKLTPAAAEDRSMVAPVTDLEAFIKKVRGFLSDFNMTVILNNNSI